MAALFDALAFQRIISRILNESDFHFSICFGCQLSCHSYNTNPFKEHLEKLLLLPMIYLSQLLCFHFSNNSSLEITM